MDFIEGTLGVACLLRKAIVVLLDPVLEVAALMQCNHDVVGMGRLRHLVVFHNMPSFCNDGVIASFRRVIIDSSRRANPGTGVRYHIFRLKDESGENSNLLAKGILRVFVFVGFDARKRSATVRVELSGEVWGLPFLIKK